MKDIWTGKCMNYKNNILLVGGIALGQTPYNGETMKNQLLLERMQQLGYRVIAVDTLHWQHRPWMLIRLLWLILFCRKAKIVVAGDISSRYLLWFLNMFPMRFCYYDWVIGGKLAEYIHNGMYSIDSLKNCKRIIVEGEYMATQLRALGLNNVVVVPNFKPVDYHPCLKDRDNTNPFRFVFLSRVRADKGIPEIVEAVSLLRNEGVNNFKVDIYGPFDDNYEMSFRSLVSTVDGVAYKGFLNLFNNGKGYEILSSYDCMLFPTYFVREGCPGIVIDAAIAGLPMIATDWNMNRYFIKEGKTGFLIPPRNARALADKMKQIMATNFDLLAMRRQCVAYAKQYDYRHVITAELMHDLGFDD